MKGIKKIIAALLVIALFCFNFHIISFAETSDTVKFNVSGRLYYDYAYEVLDILNELRTEKGLEALVMDEKLLESAMFRASETSILFSHTRPNGKPCYTAFADEETYGAGENIAIGYTSPKSVMSGWELSQGHYQNMVSIGYSSVGIGCYSSVDGVLCWVQLFAGKESTHSVKTGTKSATYTIEAKRENLSLAFDYDKDIHSLKKGETFQINLINTNKEFYYAAEKLDNSYLSFSSSDASVISFSQSGVGTITGGGKTTITVTSKIDNSLLLSAEYEGGHIYADSCDSSCDLCGKTRGNYHSFADATCTKPKTCELCGVTEGNPLDHKFVGAGDAVCDICGFERELIYVPGDADGDQTVTTGDLAAFKLYLAGSRELEEVSKTLCDLNEDGAVDTTDLAALKLKLAGIDSSGGNDSDITECDYTIERIDASYVDENGDTCLQHYFDVVRLEGDSPAIKNINSALATPDGFFLSEEEREMWIEWAIEDDCVYSRTKRSQVTHNANGYISIVDSWWTDRNSYTTWYSYAYTYNLSTGEEATLEEVTGIERDSLNKQVVNIVAKEFYEVFGMDISDIMPDFMNSDLLSDEYLDFYIENGEIVIIYNSYFGTFTDIIAHTGIYIK